MTPSASELSLEQRAAQIAGLIKEVTLPEQELLARELRKQGVCFNPYDNPLTVSVALISVQTEEGLKLLAVQRNIHPFIGQPCLPAGFVNQMEDFASAVARESEEETGVKLNPKDFIPIGSRLTERNQNLMFYRYNRVLSIEEIDLNFTSDETQKILLLSDPLSLCFPFHREEAQKYIEEFHQPLQPRKAKP